MVIGLKHYQALAEANYNNDRAKILTSDFAETFDTVDHGVLLFESSNR